MAVTTAHRLSTRASIRVRILAIAWIPSLLLIVGGIAVSGALAYQGTQITRFNDRFQADSPGVVIFAHMVMAERRESVVYLSDPAHGPTALAGVRRALDASSGPVLATARLRSQTDPAVYSQLVRDTTRYLAGLAMLRQRVDARRAGLGEVEDFYSAAFDALATSLYLVSATEPVPQAAVALVGLVALMKADNVYSQTDELALAASIGPGLSPAEYTRFVSSYGGQGALLAQAGLSLNSAGAGNFDGLFHSPAWLRLDATHRTILLRGPAGTAASSPGTGDTAGSSSAARGAPGAPSATESGANGVTGARQSAPSPTTTGRGQQGTTFAAGQAITSHPMSSGTAAATRGSLPGPAAWSADSAAVHGIVQGIAGGLAAQAYTLSRDAGRSQLDTAAAVGVLLLLLGVVVLVVTTRASSRLIARLRRLREETLSLSRERLPGVVARLRQGEQVDVSAEVVPLDLGQDEIGQVADAFNQAQETAIAAAVGEAAARSGLRTVFINIAHRSQGIVHRQLSLLDKAERAQEDPDQLALLFELDHLTTRARRNAENLIVLGGGQAGRQWRNPVPLVQVVRGAISEAHEYVRVSVGPLPQTDIVGGAVADLSHVIAELVDNATTFSPPTSRVEVRGNVVGRGIVLEIEDQGLGLEPAQLEQLNQMLHEPPDFQAMALSIEPRLGIFVVAQLAARQGIRVTLSPSPAYGGTKAVLLVPADLTREVSQHTLAAVQSGPSQPPASLPLPIGLPAPSAPSPSPGIAVGGDIYPPAPPPARRSDLAGQSLPPSIFAQGPRTLTPASRQESVPQRDVADAGRSDLADRGRPALPRRTRQTHVAAQLRTPEAAQTTDRLPIDVDPEVARRRLAAIQSGTRRARDAQHPTAHRPSSDEGPA